MLTQKFLLLPVTCYRRGRNAVPSLCLRSAFASGSLPSMEYQRTYNGLGTELDWRELKVLAESH